MKTIGVAPSTAGTLQAKMESIVSFRTLSNPFTLLSSEAKTQFITICAHLGEKKLRNFHFIPEKAVYKGPFIENLQVIYSFPYTNIADRNLELVRNSDSYSTLCSTI